MSKMQPTYASIVHDIEELCRRKEAKAYEAFEVFEKQHEKLAGVVQQTTRDRRSAVFWMFRPLRRFGGRTAYHALAEGDVESLWDELEKAMRADSGIGELSIYNGR